MAKAKKRSRPRSKIRKSETSKRVSKKKKAKSRVSFSRIWKKLGDDLLRAVEKETGCDRKEFVTRLASDPEMRRLVVERAACLPTIRPLESMEAAPAALKGASSTCRRDERGNEYSLRSTLATGHRGITEDEPLPEDEKADWRLV